MAAAVCVTHGGSVPQLRRSAAVDGVQVRAERAPHRDGRSLCARVPASRFCLGLAQPRLARVELVVIEVTLPFPCPSAAAIEAAAAAAASGAAGSACAAAATASVASCATATSVAATRVAGAGTATAVSTAAVAAAAIASAAALPARRVHGL